ncbi:NIPSNAP family protein [Roseococcus sp. DSY-14]|uniref:NIPSNAP family protein n=1 Tax=Roseococcus sp. DSY-14 TaxID=3369650 RepID=UPI00387B9580
MIVEQRIYTMHPGTIGHYVKAYGEEGLAIQKPILGRLVGWYTTEFGPLNQVIHMWAYESFEERAARRKALFADQAWLDYLAKVRPYIATQESKLLVPAAFTQVRWED